VRSTFSETPLMLEEGNTVIRATKTIELLRYPAEVHDASPSTSARRTGWAMVCCASALGLIRSSVE